MAEAIFTSSGPVELYSVEGHTRSVLVAAPEKGEKGHPLVIETLKGAGKNYPLLAAYVTVGPVSWAVKVGSHSMRSATDDGAPSFIFSNVNDKNGDLFYCVVLAKGSSNDEVGTLEAILSKLTTFHAKKRPEPAPGANVLPHISLPHVELPKVGVTQEQVNEILRKGAEDTQAVINKVGEKVNEAFHKAAELHKKYAPAPKAEPAPVDPGLHDKISKAKQAAAAGAAVAKGVATGMQAATVNIGQSLMAAAKGSDGEPPSGLLAQPAVKAAGGVGMEILRDIAAVRDAMVNSVATAWTGLKDATVEVFEHQYGQPAAATVKDAGEVVEGIANMGMAMKLTQPTQVLLTSAKEGTDAKAAGAGGSDADKLAAEKAALEKELAALKAERAAAAKAGGSGSAQQPATAAEQQQQKRGPFGLPFAFGGSS